jgi:hypothetical protein
MSRAAVWAFFCIGLIILLITPYGNFPDEQSHFHYAMYLREHVKLPPLSFDIREMPIPEAFQPPLYYFAGALLLLPGFTEQSAIFLLRLLSLLLGTGTVLLTRKTADLLFPEKADLVGLITALVAFNPQFIFTHSGISNISVTSFVCALTFYLSAKGIRERNFSGSLATFLIGFSFGLALLSRTITIYLLPVCLAAIVLMLKQSRKLLIREIIIQFSIFAITALITSGWWYIRNWIQFGDPFLWAIHQTTVGAGWVKQDPVNLLYLLQSLALLHATFWAYFGRNEFHAGVTEYVVLMIIILVGMIGLFEIVFMKRDRNTVPGNSRNLFLLAFFAAGLAFLEILILQAKISSPQGRYLYMAIVPIGILIGAGLSNVFPVEYQTKSNRLLSIFLFCWCLYLLSFYWLPHYL